MAVMILKNKQRIEDGPPDPPTHDARGKLTRHGALLEARKLWGDLGTISSSEAHSDLAEFASTLRQLPELPCLVWRIGSFGMTVGRALTWERALQRSAQRKAKMDARAEAEAKREALEIAEAFMERNKGALEGLA